MTARVCLNHPVRWDLLPRSGYVRQRHCPTLGWGTGSPSTAVSLAPPDGSGSGVSSARVLVVRVARDPDDLTNLSDAVPGILLQRERHLLLPLVDALRTPAFPPSGPGRRQARVGPLADQVTFELRQGSEYMEDKLAARGRGIDLLLQTPEADAALSIHGW